MPSFNNTSWSNNSFWSTDDDGYPNDWILPPPSDSGIDDWISPREWMTPPSASLGSASPTFAPPPDPFATKLSSIPVASLGAVPWAPTPFELPPGLGAGGILGGLDSLRSFGQGGILGGLAQLAPTTPWPLAGPRFSRIPEPAPLPNSAGLSGQSSGPRLGADGPSARFGQGDFFGTPGSSQRTPAPTQNNFGFFPDSWRSLAPNADSYHGLDVGSLVHPVADEWEEEQHERTQRQRQLDLFNERAFGTTPHLGSGAPFLIPPRGRTNQLPSVPPNTQQAPEATPQPPRASPPPGTSPVTPPSIGTPSITAPRIGPPDSSFNSAAAAEQPPTPVLPSGKFSPYDTYSRQWLPPVQGIRNALATGKGVQDAISAALPKYDDDTTFSVLITNEGNVVPFRSRGKDSFYPGYASGAHTETQAARWMSDHGSTGGVLFHNNTRGTCGYCDNQVATFLPPGVPFWIVPPADARAKVPSDVVYPAKYVGNAKDPKLSPQLDLFGRNP
jgi:hypothetical protein